MSCRLLLGERRERGPGQRDRTPRATVAFAPVESVQTEVSFRTENFLGRALGADCSFIDRGVPRGPDLVLSEPRRRPPGPCPRQAASRRRRESRVDRGPRRGRSKRYLPFRRRADRTCPPPELGASTFAVRGVPPPTPPLWTEVGRPSSRVHVLVTRSPCHPHPSCIRRSRRFASLVRSALVVQRGAVSGPRRGWRRPPSSSLLWISQ